MGAGVRFACAIEPAASEQQIAAALPTQAAPEEPVELWRVTRQADLFIETRHGGWGLRLASPDRIAEATRRARERRPGQFRDGDLVIGEFLDASHELLVRSAGGGILIERPAHDRDDWRYGADTVSDFLQRYAAYLGQKHWARDRPDAGTWQSPR
jgi:hypothetical protein